MSLVGRSTIYRVLFLGYVPTTRVFSYYRLRLRVGDVYVLFRSHLVGQPVMVLHSRLLDFVKVRVFRVYFHDFYVVVLFRVFVCGDGK